MRKPRRPSRGFTLIEIMVVMTILVIMAAMVVPRMLNGRHREFNLAADRVADMMTMFAQRSSLSDNAVGIRYDEERHEVQFAVLENTDVNDDGERSWRSDLTVPAVVLPEWMAEPELRADGETVDTRIRPLASEPGQPRPILEIRLASAEQRVTLLLAAHSIAPIRPDDNRGFELPKPLDLDDAGMTTEDW